MTQQFLEKRGLPTLDAAAHTILAVASTQGCIEKNVYEAFGAECLMDVMDLCRDHPEKFKACLEKLKLDDSDLDAQDSVGNFVKASLTLYFETHAKKIAENETARAADEAEAEGEPAAKKAKTDGEAGEADEPIEPASGEKMQTEKMQAETPEATPEEVPPAAAEAQATETPEKLGTNEETPEV